MFLEIKKDVRVQSSSWLMGENQVLDLHLKSKKYFTHSLTCSGARFQHVGYITALLVFAAETKHGKDSGFAGDNLHVVLNSLLPLSVTTSQSIYICWCPGPPQAIQKREYLGYSFNTKKQRSQC